MLPRLKKGEDLYGGLMGVSMKGIDIYADEPELAAVQPNSPAYQAGLKPGDKIVEIDGHKIARQAELKHLLGPHYAGDKVKVVVLRGKERLEKAIELVGKLIPYENPFLGGTAAARSPRDERAGRDDALRLSRQPRRQGRPQAGRSHHRLDGKPVKSLDELFEQLASFSAQPEGEAGSPSRRRNAEARSAACRRCPRRSPANCRARTTIRPPAVEGAKPATGVVKIKLPESKTECIAYVPENYNRQARLRRRRLAPSAGRLQGRGAGRPLEGSVREARSDSARPQERRSGQVAANRIGLRQARRSTISRANITSIAPAPSSAGQEGGGGMAYLFALSAIAKSSTAWRRSAPCCRSARRSRPTIRCCGWRSTSASRKRTRSNRRSKRRPRGCEPKNIRSRSKTSAPPRAPSPPTNSPNSPAGSTRWIESK